MTLKQNFLVAQVLAAANALGGVMAYPIFGSYALLWAAIGPLGVGIYSLTLRCNQCGELAMRRKGSFLGVNVEYWGGFTFPERCSKCNQTFE